MGQRQKGNGDILLRTESKIATNIFHVGTKISMGQHYAFGFAGGAGSVEDRSKLSRQDLRSAQAIGGNFRSTRGGDQRFVAQTIGGNVIAGVGDNNVFQLRKFAANGQQRNQLFVASDENDFGIGMFQDVRGAFRRLLEIDRNSDATIAVDGKIGGVPLRTIGGKESDAVAGFYAKFKERLGKPGGATKEFLAGNLLPAGLIAKHLRPWTGPRIHCVEKFGWKGSVAHWRKRRGSKRNC